MSHLSQASVLPLARADLQITSHLHGICRHLNLIRISAGGNTTLKARKRVCKKLTNVSRLPSITNPHPTLTNSISRCTYNTCIYNSYESNINHLRICKHYKTLEDNLLGHLVPLRTSSRIHQWLKTSASAVGCHHAYRTENKNVCLRKYWLRTGMLTSLWLQLCLGKKKRQRKLHVLILFKNSFKTTKKRLCLPWDAGTLFLPELGVLLLLKHLWLRSQFEGWEKWILIKSMSLFHFTQRKTFLSSCQISSQGLAPVNWTWVINSYLFKMSSHEFRLNFSLNS